MVTASAPLRVHRSTTYEAMLEGVDADSYEATLAWIAPEMKLRVRWSGAVTVGGT